METLIDFVDVRDSNKWTMNKAQLRLVDGMSKSPFLLVLIWAIIERAKKGG